MDVKPGGYKKTEVGVIPEDWEVKALRDFGFDISDGNYSSKYPKASEFVNHGVPFIRANNIRNMSVVDDDMRFISQELHSELLKGHLKANDLLITTRGEIGQIAFVPDSHIDSNINAQLVRINVDRQGCNHRFIGYMMSSVQNQSENLQTGSALKQLPVGRLKELLLAIPPSIAEQTAIATALSDVDALIDSLEQLIKKKRQIKQGAMQELLTGKRRLPGFGNGKNAYKKTEVGVIPEDWQVQYLSKICNKITTGKLDANAMKPDGGYPFYTCAKEHYWIDEFAFDDEALLISGNGANVGYIHFYKGKFNAYQRTYVLTGFSSVIHFVKAFLERNLQERIKVEANAGNTPYIVMGTLAEMQIALPPTKVEQTAIATALSDIDSEIESLETKLSKTRHLKQGMMQELLTGRIRLI